MRTTTELAVWVARYDNPVLDVVTLDRVRHRRSPPRSCRRTAATATGSLRFVRRCRAGNRFDDIFEGRAQPRQGRRRGREELLPPRRSPQCMRVPLSSPLARPRRCRAGRTSRRTRPMPPCGARSRRRPDRRAGGTASAGTLARAPSAARRFRFSDIPRLPLLPADRVEHVARKVELFLRRDNDGVQPLRCSCPCFQPRGLTPR